MCRMIAAPSGLPGRLLIDPFLRFGRGRNTTNEVNTELGKVTHGDGWGAVYESEGSLQVHRSVEPCWEGEEIEALREKRVFLLHARRASQGGVALENTHPFEQEIDGARWFFCHNGAVREDLPTAGVLTKADPTDSEKLLGLLQPYIREDRALEGFCARESDVLSSFRAREGDILAGLRTVYCGIRNFTSLNSFLLGPDDLWAVCLHTKNPLYYTLTLSETPDGPIVSSEPLDEFAGKQTALHNGTVLRIDRRTGATETHSLCPGRD